MKTENFEITDFLLNESFQSYVIHRNPKDVAYWENWLKEHPEAYDVTDKAKEIITFIITRKAQPRNESISQQVYERLRIQILENDRKKKPVKINLRYASYAASLILMVGLLFIWRSHKVPDHTMQNKQFLQVIVPQGQRSQLVLPDGTKVWLNSGTVFKYPQEFLKTKREVFLSGEAFFNVAHTKDLPFEVHMNENLSVRVLGTEFNVKCYSEEKIIETTLVKGMIRLIKADKDNRVVQEYNLKPDEKATYVKTNQKLTITRLSNDNLLGSSANQLKAKTNNTVSEKLEPITAWKDDALVFQDETFEDIGVKMERWFGLKISIDDESLKKERFTGKFVNKETIYQILDIFNRSEPIRYTIKNKEIFIRKGRSTKS